MKAGTFTEEQTVALLQDAQKGEKTVEKLCRDLGCSTASQGALHPTRLAQRQRQSVPAWGGHQFQTPVSSQSARPLHCQP